jgi:hypothetical protein
LKLPAGSLDGWALEFSSTAIAISRLVRYREENEVIGGGKRERKGGYGGEGERLTDCGKVDKEVFADRRTDE